MPPSHDYVTASRSTFAALAEVSKAVRASPAQTLGPGFDPDRAILDLTVATQDLASLLRIVENLPHRLLQSELLFVRARSIAPRADILAERLKGSLVVARPQDAPHLIRVTREAAFVAAESFKHLIILTADRLTPKTDTTGLLSEPQL